MHVKSLNSVPITKEVAYKLLALDNRSVNSLFTFSRELSYSKFGKTLHCYAPGLLSYNTEIFSQINPNKFAAISITGKICSLMCEHCKGKILDAMIPATTPDELYQVCKNMRKQGCEGFLISGGSLSNGSVPFSKFIEVITKIKKELNCTIIAHTGLISQKAAEELKRAGVEAALIDVIGDKDTIRDIYHLDATPKDYEKSLECLNIVGLEITPHVIVGLNRGQIKGEIEALDMIARHNPKSVIIVALMPLLGTPMEGIAPVPPLTIAKFVSIARLMMPDVPVMLGCGRPKGLHKIRTDIAAIQAGINGIAYPAEEALKYAIKIGFDLKFHEICCSLIYKVN